MEHSDKTLCELYKKYIQNYMNLLSIISTYFKNKICNYTRSNCAFSLPIGYFSSFYSQNCVCILILKNLLTYLLTYLLLHGPESFLKSQLVLQLVKKFPAFMKPESSSPYPQVPATCPYPEPIPFSPHNSFPLPEDQS